MKLLGIVATPLACHPSYSVSSQSVCLLFTTTSYDQKMASGGSVNDVSVGTQKVVTFTPEVK